MKEATLSCLYARIRTLPGNAAVEKNNLLVECFLNNRNAANHGSFLENKCKCRKQGS